MSFGREKGFDNEASQAPVDGQAKGGERLTPEAQHADTAEERRTSVINNGGMVVRVTREEDTHEGGGATTGIFHDMYIEEQGGRLDWAKERVFHHQPLYGRLYGAFAPNNDLQGSLRGYLDYGRAY